MSSYRGNYCIGREPQLRAGHNRETWDKISAYIKQSGGKASFDDLCWVAKDHKNCGKEEGHPEKFINYCASKRNSWLKKCN